ncbi:MAG: glycosyltransferase family 4 protein [Pseudomonadota bacterium]
MKRVFFVQNGDFAEAFAAFARGEAETYRDQKRSVDYVNRLALENEVSTLTLGTQRHEVELARNLFAYGLPREDCDRAAVRHLFNRIRPSHLVLRTPHRVFLQEAAKRDTFVLPVFADLFSGRGCRARYNHLRLRHALLNCSIPCISNHSLNASNSVVSALGVKPDLVVPWDWRRVPVEDHPKRCVKDRQSPTLFFAGALLKEKGIGDCLSAVARLRRSGLDWRFTVAGHDGDDTWRRRADALGISNAVTFLGRVPNARVRQEMRAHDFVIVPSHHSYPEGLPNTIYEALASRSVLVISDHPAFAGRLKPDRDCLVFLAGEEAALADCLTRAAQTPALYERISENAREAHDSLYVGMEWTALIDRFLQDPGDVTGWVKANALSRLERSSA